MNDILFTTQSQDITVGKDEHLTIFDIFLEGETVEKKINVFLDAEGASVELYGLFFGNQSQMFTASHIVHHRAPHTKSILKTKGALNGKSRADYKALIKIHPGQAGCSGAQEEHTLLLTDKVHIDAVPSLEIGNNDVAASHSVATTHIDDLKKFYLTSRGIGEGDAVRMIVEGHFSDILANLPQEKRAEIEKQIASKI